MQLVSVNLGEERAITNAKTSGKTGIYKTAMETAVQISVNGLIGDTICDTQNHGGVDQAVYIYSVPDYEYWSNRLERELPFGIFGENLTITQLESKRLAIGDQLQIGEVTLEVTAPRIPCVTLAARMGIPAFAKWFREAERPGAYCRVIKEGAVQVGDPVTLIPYQDQPVTIIELFHHMFNPDLNEATVCRLLAAPIAIRARTMLEYQLESLRYNK